MKLMSSADLSISWNGLCAPNFSIPRRQFTRNLVKAIWLARNPIDYQALLESGVTEVELREMIQLGLIKEVESEKDARLSLWEKYNWVRAQRLMTDMSAYGFSCSAVAQDLFSIQSRFNLEGTKKFIDRRCSRLFKNDNVPKLEFENLMNCFHKAISHIPWLQVYVVVQGVESLNKSILYFDKTSNRLLELKAKYSSTQLLRVIQGQWWLGGGGACCLFAVDFEKILTQKYLRTDDYIGLYLTLGAVGHELLYNIYQYDLAAWMTPAVNEEVASDLLGPRGSLSEVLYFLKFGIPDRAQEQEFGIENLKFRQPDFSNMERYGS